MKFLFLVFYVSYVCAHEEGKPRKIDASFLDQVKVDVENARQKFPETLKVDEATLELPSAMSLLLSGQIGVKNVVLTGAKNFKFNAAMFPPQITFNLPKAKLDVDYSLDLKGLESETLKIDGSGHASLEITEFDVKVDINPTIFQGPKESIKGIKVTLGSAKVSLTGLLSDEELSNAVETWINSNVMQLFKKRVAVITDLVKNFLNSVLPIYIKVMNKRG